MSLRMNRRTFLGHSAGAAAGLVILRCAASARGAPANGKLNVALVGLGGRGEWFVDTIPKMENVVALCDVNEIKAAKAYAKYPDIRKFQDFRKMLDEMGKSVDAVVIATPDHTHAVISAAAMKAGKHVYCEKPLTRLVHESRVLRETARKQKVATQLGNQGTASEPFRRAVELIRGGVIGQVKEVYVWNNGGGPGATQPPQGTQPVPDTLKWDLWLGPAADRPFHADWLAKWHGWRDFATGQLGNWASHSANLAFMALSVDTLWRADPAKDPNPILGIEAKVSEINRLSFPKWEVIKFDIPARAGLPPITIQWHNGGSAPGSRDLLEAAMGEGLDWGDKGEKKWRDHAGTVIVGTEGKIHATGHNATFRLLPEEKFKDFKAPAPTLPRSPGHEREWFDACRGGPAAMSNFDYGGPLAEFLLLGNLATQFDHKLQYDPVAGKIIGDDKADQGLRGEYRQGWTL